MESTTVQCSNGTMIFEEKGNKIFTPKLPLLKGQFNEISGFMFFHVIRNIRHRECV